MNKRLFFTLAIVFFIEGIGQGQAKSVATKQFVLSDSLHTTAIVVDKHEDDVVRVAANALAEDIKDITGRLPAVVSMPDTHRQDIKIIIGTTSNPDIQAYIRDNNLPDIQGKWEHFFIRVIQHKEKAPQKILLIAGSDPRGVAYGVFTLSRRIGVSPWKWWADVTPHKRNRITLPGDIAIEQEPSVKYRGIFINDEDWGLRPWASKTYEPDLGNIGPKTYAKVFELLLRLKANTVWPAMHPGTTPFFEVKGNAEMAKRYDIVIGTSHAEPMLRNNVGEWHAKRMGDFNYVTNRDSVYNYWKKRVMQVADGHNIYTIGMRGIHDGKMEGASTLSEQAAVLSQVFNDQRGLLEKYVNQDLTKIPQAFIPYKEVLPVYDNGLKVPDDVTLMWPDDNYGYIRRLSNEAERQREGSAGVYYHLSYWGRPHDYLWLSSVQPGLIWEEMKKAWDYGAKKMWIVNVGDIKPAAYNIQFFMDMAWDVEQLRQDDLREYMNQWHTQLFGNTNATEITQVMEEYYRLAAIRKPEFMGWSQTEPTTPTHNTAFRPFLNGDEMEKRTKAYKRLVANVDRIKKTIPENRKEAFFELISYPIKGATYMNKKFLYAQKSRLFAKYDLPIANRYASWAENAYDSIRILTEEYNHLLNGKWKGMMDSAPRGLPVFQAPSLPENVVSQGRGLLLWPEGKNNPEPENTRLKLPTFNPYSTKEHFIKLFNKGDQPLKWRISTAYPWIRLNKTSGTLKEEDQLIVSIDWDQIPHSIHEGNLIIHSGDSSYVVNISTAPAIDGEIPDNPVVENNGRVFIQAPDFVEKYSFSKVHQWQGIQQLGYTNNAHALLPIPKEKEKKLNTSYLKYRFYTYSRGLAEITVYTLPTQPVNDSADMRLALSLDGGEKHSLSFKTEGRSEEWKQNVLSNHAKPVLKYYFEHPGWHTIKIYPLDPGVILDQIMINFKPEEEIYAVPVR